MDFERVLRSFELLDFERMAMKLDDDDDDKAGDEEEDEFHVVCDDTGEDEHDGTRSETHEKMVVKTSDANREGEKNTAGRSGGNSGGGDEASVEPQQPQSTLPPPPPPSSATKVAGTTENTNATTTTITTTTDTTTKTTTTTQPTRTPLPPPPPPQGQSSLMPSHARAASAAQLASVKPNGARAFDTKLWRRLADNAVRRLASASKDSTSGSAEAPRRELEQLLQVFPTAREYWVKTVEAELSGLVAASTSDGDNGTDDTRGECVERMKSVFSRSLLTCADVELWCLYIKFIRDTSDATSVEGVASIREAYEYTTSHIGQDVDAGPIWFAYVAFLKTTSPMLLFPEKASDDGTGPNALQGAAQTAAMRAVFKQALAVPSETTTETMWRDYELFENGASKALAKKHLNEMTPIHVAAKMALTKRRETRACLLLTVPQSDTISHAHGHHQPNIAIKDMLAIPPEMSAAAAAELDAAMRSWADVLSFEMSNVQRIDTDLVVRRVKLVFEQGLRTFHLVATWWLSYGKWLEEQNLDDDAVEVWTRATSALPACLALHFARAECEEARGNIDAAAQVYESLIRAIEADATEADTAVAAVNAASDSRRKKGDEKQEEMSGEEKDDGDDDDDAVATPVRAFATDDDAALVYLTWFRFAGRAQSVDDARAVVKRAKKSPIPCPWQVYAGAALMEWGWRGLENETDTEKLCCRYFDLGLKHCPGVISLILSYAAFLEQRGDDRNVRALFEREIANKGMKGSNLKTLWDAYIRFEMARSSMTVIRALDTRRKESLEIEKAQGMSAADAAGAAAAAAASAAAVAAASGSSPANVADTVAAIEPPCIASCYDFLADCEMRAEDKFETLGLLPMRPDAFVLHRGLHGNGDSVTGVDGDTAGTYDDDSDDEPGMDAGTGDAITRGTKSSPAKDMSLEELTPWPNGSPIAKDVRDGFVVLKSLPKSGVPMPLPALLHKLSLKLKTSAPSSDPTVALPPASLVMAILLASDTSLATASTLNEDDMMAHIEALTNGTTAQKRSMSGAPSAPPPRKRGRRGGTTKNTSPTAAPASTANPVGGGSAAQAGVRRPAAPVPVNDVFRMRQQQRRQVPRP